MISLIETVDLQRGGGGVVKRSGSTTEIYIFIKYILFGPTPTPENNLDRPLAKLLIRSALREDTFVGLFWGYVRKSKAIHSLRIVWLMLHKKCLYNFKASKPLVVIFKMERKGQILKTT